MVIEFTTYYAFILCAAVPRLAYLCKEYEIEITKLPQAVVPFPVYEARVVFLASLVGLRREALAEEPVFVILPGWELMILTVEDSLLFVYVCK